MLKRLKFLYLFQKPNSLPVLRKFALLVTPNYSLVRKKCLGLLPQGWFFPCNLLAAQFGKRENVCLQDQWEKESTSENGK